MFEINLKHRTNRRSAIFLSAAAMLAMSVNPEKIMEAVRQSLTLCVCSLLPALFPFMVASSVFVSSVTPKTFDFAKSFFYRLFGISPCAAAALIPGMICGYPVGADCTCRLYRSNMISKSEAETLIAFSNNSGPLFIIGSLGAGTLGSSKTGTALYLIHICAAVICGILLKPFTAVGLCERSSYKKSEKGFTDAVSDSTAAILRICGFVVSFAVINELLKPVFGALPSHLKCIAASALELTNGVSITNTAIENTHAKLIIISGALGWSGLSVHMQVKSIVADTNLSLKKYFIARPLICALSVLMSSILLKNTSPESQAAVFDMRAVFKALTAVCAFIAVCTIGAALFRQTSSARGRHLAHLKSSQGHVRKTS